MGKPVTFFYSVRRGGGVVKKARKDPEWVKRGERRINLNTFSYQGKIPGIFCPKHFQWGSNGNENKRERGERESIERTVRGREVLFKEERIA
jgi:hypothetical protein